MDIETLKIFIEVIRKGNFTQVARGRNVAASSISRAMASLEKQLGVRLLQRTTRSLVPTEAGRLYFSRVEAIVEDLELARNAVVDSSRQLTGELRVTASASLGITCIAPLLSEFSERYPGLIVDLSLTDSVVDLLSDNIDVAIRQGPLVDSTLVAERLMTTVYNVCASPKYIQRHGLPACPAELSKHNCLVFPLPGFRSNWIFKNTAAEVEEVSIGGDLLVNNGLVLKQCALDGAGLVLLSNWLIHKELQTGQLVNIFLNHKVTATNFDTVVSAVYPSRSYVPAKVRAWIDFLKEKWNSSDF